MRARWLRRIALNLSLTAASCAVDQRELSFQASQGGAPSGAGSGGASGSASGSGSEPAGPAGGGQAVTLPGGGGSAGDSGRGATVGGETAMGHLGTGGAAGETAENLGGEPGETGEPGDFPCGNLNRNAADDCVETLVANSRFDASDAGWDSEGSLKQAWIANDARGGPSGSLLLTYAAPVAAGTGKSALASHQCVLAWGGDEFELGARVWIAGAQGGGEAGINLVFYGRDGCEGAPLAAQNAAFSSDRERWAVIRSNVVVPAGTRSARVRLTLAKPFDQPSLEAQFDDVLFVKL